MISSKSLPNFLKISLNGEISNTHKFYLWTKVWESNRKNTAFFLGIKKDNKFSQNNLIKNICVGDKQAGTSKKPIDLSTLGGGGFTVDDITLLVEAMTIECESTVKKYASQPKTLINMLVLLWQTLETDTLQQLKNAIAKNQQVAQKVKEALKNQAPDEKNIQVASIWEHLTDEFNIETAILTAGYPPDFALDLSVGQRYDRRIGDDNVNWSPDGNWFPITIVQRLSNGEVDTFPEEGPNKGADKKVLRCDNVKIVFINQPINFLFKNKSERDKTKKKLKENPCIAIYYNTETKRIEIIGSFPRAHFMGLNYLLPENFLFHDEQQQLLTNILKTMPNETFQEKWMPKDYDLTTWDAPINKLYHVLHQFNLPSHLPALFTQYDGDLSKLNPSQFCQSGSITGRSWDFHRHTYTKDRKDVITTKKFFFNPPEQMKQALQQDGITWTKQLIIPVRIKEIKAYNNVCLYFPSPTEANKTCQYGMNWREFTPCLVVSATSTKKKVDWQAPLGNTRGGVTYAKSTIDCNTGIMPPRSLNMTLQERGKIKEKLDNWKRVSNQTRCNTTHYQASINNCHKTLKTLLFDCDTFNAYKNTVHQKLQLTSDKSISFQLRHTYAWAILDVLFFICVIPQLIKTVCYISDYLQRKDNAGHGYDGLFFFQKKTQREKSLLDTLNAIEQELVEPEAPQMNIV